MKLRQDIAEKNKELAESKEQLESLRKQIVVIKESINGGIANGGSGLKGPKGDQETQTSGHNTPNTGDCQSQASTNRRRHKRGCTIL